ncbi:outer membrane lipoprotein carrier protein LolA [Kutzneria buriramensis]|uniref:Outer membrane lipoprotein-sorting protein n=1 Tax=Kutzneria buriramensis TaxID=1045776 RepID=A0A3E0HC17_9PSEU|nr:outer membrane lipoprotein carrier protein LolA [Kutzneria buriramensis]REH41931.1 outer membrane lipoprotein-sorting protein [Kutzneria buriramensis]
MNGKQAGLVVGAAGVLAGVVGLGVLALPAGAGPAPVLPQVSAEQLVQSVLTTKTVPALAGTVSATNNLGLPAVPALGGQASKFLTDGTTKAQVWTDGKGKGRVSLPGATSEETMVFDGTTLWDWTSQNNTVHKSTDTPEQKAHPDKPGSGEMATDPAAAAKQIIALIDKDSTVKVDGTATVAGRPAYELVLAPKPTEKTLLREVRIAIDSETKIPLQLSVLANGNAQPVAQIGFSTLQIAPQDPALFTFTPPAGANVVTGEDKKVADKAPDQLKNAAKPQIVGSGWDTVLVEKLPAGTLGGDRSATTKGGENFDPSKLLGQLGKRVSGPWGSGYEISTAVGTALVLDDGRIAVGAVPEQALITALASVK